MAAQYVLLKYSTVRVAVTLTRQPETNVASLWQLLRGWASRRMFETHAEYSTHTYCSCRYLGTVLTGMGKEVIFGLKKH